MKTERSGAGALLTRSIPMEILAGSRIDLESWSLLVNDAAMTKISQSRGWTQTIRFNTNGKTVHDMIRDIMTVDHWNGDILFLSLAGSHRLTDFGLSLVKPMCSNLVELNLSRCISVTDVGVRDLVMASPRLQVLNLSGCGQLLGGCLVAVADSCSHLRCLNVSRCTQLQSWAYHKLLNCCTKLELLDVSSTTFTNGEILTLAQNVSTLTSLNVEDCPQLSDSGLTALIQQSPNLEALHLVRHQLAFRITDMTMLPLGQHCKMLQVLDVTGCEFLTDVGIGWLAGGCHHLTDLNLTGCTKVLWLYARLRADRLTFFRVTLTSLLMVH